MPILIDGHNLIGRLPSLSLQDPDDEQQLVALLRPYRSRTGKAITVVFDPGAEFALPQARRQGGIEVVFASQGSSADEVILRRVQRSRDRAGIVVVTSDRSLAQRWPPMVPESGRLRIWPQSLPRRPRTPSESSPCPPRSWKRG